MTIDAIMNPPTKAQTNSALRFVLAVTEAIREAKQIPAGHLYAILCGKLDITAFDAMLRTVQNTGLVERRGDLLV